jgi:hypothetical protein
MFMRSFPNSAAKKAGMSFMENINDTVIVYVLSSLTDFASARWTICNFFSDRLVTVWTEFHGCHSKRCLVSEQPFGWSVKKGGDENKTNQKLRGHKMSI